MKEISFLKLEEIIFIHKQEVELSGSPKEIRDLEGLKSCVEASKASFEGEYLYDIFGMATAYITCLTMRHPFIDGNKRVALATALTFLYLNGFMINEAHDEELADLVVDFIIRKITKENVAQFLRDNSYKLS
jgi:death-on-curing protein